MKKLHLIAVFAVLSVFALAGSAAAGNYSYSFKNNMNMFTLSPIDNSDSVCSVQIDARTGAGVEASKTISAIKAGQQISATLTSAKCNLIRIKATCKFKDYLGTPKTESKQNDRNCTGGEGYLSPSPFDYQSFTTFSINIY
jgi:hypothetical protein